MNNKSMPEIGSDMTQTEPGAHVERRPADPTGTRADAGEWTKLGAELDEEFLRDQERSQREALELAAGIKKKKDTHLEQPPSDRAQLWAGVAKLGVGAVVPGVQGGAKHIGYGLDAIFAGIENAGHAALKPFEKYLKWIPFLGPWLVEKPAKTWKERDEEAKKKKEQEKKKKEKEGKKVKKLQDQGFTEETAKALLETVSEKEEEGEEKEKKEEKKEESGGEEKKAG